MTSPVAADLSEYMTPREFAALSSDAHHAVWRAHAEHRVDAVPALASAPSHVRLYHRGQVRALLTELEAIR